MPTFKQKLGDIIFEHDTPVAKLFDVVLLITILLSVLLIMLESVAGIRLRYGTLLKNLEWGFTSLFLLRVYAAYNRKKYLTSFFGIVDLLAIIPSYLSLFLVGSQYFIVIRSLRLLRVFRVLKLVQFVGEATILSKALQASRAKITVFMITVVTLVTIIGSIMYLVEGSENGFNNIPISIYWAIVTLTTVGYGDIAPQTPFSKFLASLVMILGYAIIAVPTGIVTAELSKVERSRNDLKRCPNCQRLGHEPDAVFCKFCAELLEE